MMVRGITGYHGGNVSAFDVNSLTVPHTALIQNYEDLGDFTATAGWTVLGNDTTTLATSANHILGTASLSFAKVDGAANTVYAGIQQTIDSVDGSRFSPSDLVEASVYISNKANVVNAFVRLGTDSSNYNVWQLLAADITNAVWSPFEKALDSCVVAVTGNGWNPAAITYVCVGVQFDLETRALAGILFDHVRIVTAQLTS
jgi:hypothetical protein